MARSGTSVTEFFQRFPNEQACLDQVFKAKWGNRGRCPHCNQQGGKWFHILGTKKYQHSCRTQHSPLKDTAIYRSNLSLMAWFYALLLVSNSETGMRSNFIRRQLGIGVKSAHRMSNQLRLHFASQARPEQLGGHGKLVHIDEVFLRIIVDRSLSRHRNAVVMGLNCEGQVISGIIPNYRRVTVMSAIERFVRLGSTIVTDGAPQYRRLGNDGWKHVTINHNAAFHNFSGVTNNPIESYWRLLRRPLRLYRQVADQNLWGFLAEIEYRFNSRFSSGSLFDDAIESFPEISPRTIRKIRSQFDWRDLA